MKFLNFAWGLILLIVFASSVGVTKINAAVVGDISLPARKTDLAYHILYRVLGEDAWEYAARDIGNNIRTYRVYDLNPNTKYEFTIITVGNNGISSVAPKKILTPQVYDVEKTTEKNKKYPPVGVNSVKVEWNFNSKAQSYNIYYRERGVENWTHSVVKLSQTTDKYTIRRLVSTRAYVYKVTGIDSQGREFVVVSERDLKPKK